MSIHKRLICFLSLVSFFASTYAQLSSVDQFRFIENKGQWHTDAKFVSPIPSGSIILTDNSIYYHFYDTDKEKEILENSHHGNLKKNETISNHTFKVSFLNSIKPNYRPSDKLIEKRNYLKGNDPTKWTHAISAYETITYENIFKGIDFTIQEKNSTVKYEFIVQPGSKPKQIQLAYEGVESIQILDERLVVQTSLGSVIDDKPFAYQIIGDSRIQISCEYQLEGNLLSYRLGKYNKKHPLIIDPRLIFSTSSGSLADNWGNTACYDRRGNLYTGGTLFLTTGGNTPVPLPTGFPTTIGAFQSTFQGGDTDMAIMKFDSSGTFLHYSTIIGGNDAEIPTSTVVNDNNELYILGTTASSNFPVTTGAFDTDFSGSTSIIVWYVNGIPVDTGMTFTPPPLSYTDNVSAVLESGYTCDENKRKTSNTITVTPPSSLNIKLTASSNSFCPGDSIVFTTTSETGNSPTYEWLINGIPSGSSGSSFILNTPNDGDTIKVIVTDNSCTTTNPTDTAFIVLHNATADLVSASISTDNIPICTGETHLFKSNIINGGNSPQYFWWHNGINIGNLDSIETNNFINGDSVYLEVVSSLNCLTSDTAISNRFIINNASVTKPVSITITPEPYSSCDSMVVLNAEITNGSTSPFIRWYLESGGAFVNIKSGSNLTEFRYQRAYGENNSVYAEVQSSSFCTPIAFSRSLDFNVSTSEVKSQDLTIEAIANDDCDIPTSFSASSPTNINSQNYNPVGGYSFKNGTDIVVIHLSADGSTILNSTFVGGTGNDGILQTFSPLTNNYGDQLRGDINLDSMGNVYIASVTSSPDFPIINAAQTTYGGGQTDAVIFKMNPTLSSLTFSTFLGGTQSDGAYSIQTNKQQQVYVGGGTSSNNFPTTSTSYITNPQGDVDGFVTKLSSNGSTILNSTRLGTDQFDQTYFVQLDTSGNAYALGQTKGNYPLLKSKYNNPNSGLFIQKLSSDLSTPIYSTVIGDTISTDPIIPNISPTAFLINECENIFISGWGGGSNIGVDQNLIDGFNYTAAYYHNGGNTFNMPISSNAFQESTDGSDFYLMALLKDADSLLYGTYFGGPNSEEHVDGGTSRFDHRGIVYQSVCSGCKTCRTCGPHLDFPTFPDDNSQATYPKRNSSGNCNNGVFKFDLATLEAEFKHDEYCEPNTITFINLTNGGIDFNWDFGDGQSAYTLLPDTVRHTYDLPGTYIVSLIATDLTTCVGRDTATKEIFVPEYFTANHQYDTICEGITKNIELLDFDPAFGYKWTPPTQLNNDSIYNPDFTADSTIQYLITVTDTNGCIKIDTFDIEVRPEVIADFKPLSNCNFQKITLENTSTNATSYEWHIDTTEIFTTTKKDTIVRTLPKGTYVINLQAFNDSTCNKSDVADAQTLVIFDSISTAGDTTMCKWETAHPRVILGNNPIWETSSSLSCTNCTNPLATPITTTEYIVSIKQDTCIDRDTITVTIIPDSLPLAIINVDPPRCIDSTVYFEGLIERNNCECCEEIKSWQWTFDDGTSSFEENPSKLYTTEGYHFIELKIIARDTVYTTTDFSLLPADSCIKNIYIPNAFTPNEDGENDLLFVRAVGIVQLDFHLFNRWGEEIFTTTNKNKGWNGTYKGSIMSPQVFTYTCHATFWDGEEFYQEGNVTLLE